MKPFCLVALSLLSSCCAFHKCPESTAAAATQSAAKDEVAYKVIPLRYAAAGELAAVLRNSVAKQGGRRAPQIMSDERTNSLVVSCAPEQMGSVEKLISELDVEVKKPR